MSRHCPLAGLRIVLTRTPEQAEPWLARLKQLGADAINVPMIEVIACDPGPLDAALDALSSYDWLAFTSANGVQFTVRRIDERGAAPATLFAGKRVTAVGDATLRALEDAGIEVLLKPDVATGVELADALIAQGVRGRRVLQPTSRIGRAELAEGLRAAGADVDVVSVYDTVTPRDPDQTALAAIAENRVDVVVLASPSAARNLAAALHSLPGDGVAVACIGPTTASAARELGYRTVHVAKESSLTGLIAVLTDERAGAHAQ